MHVSWGIGVLSFKESLPYWNHETYKNNKGQLVLKAKSKIFI